MRIAYICLDPGIPVFGNKGCSIHVQEIIRAYCKAGHEVTLFAARTGGTAPAGFETVRTRKIDIRNSSTVAEREDACIDANKLLFSELEHAGPFDLVYERYSLWSCSGIHFARFNGIPSTLEVNAPLIEEQRRYRAIVNTIVAKKIAQYVFSSASTVVAVSNEVADYVTELTTWPNNVIVIPNGINPDRFSVSVNRIRSDEDVFTIGFVGSLKNWHGVPVLVEALSAIRTHRPYRLLVVGDGPEKQDLIRRAERNGIRDRIDFVGQVPHERLPEYLSRMDVGTAPYAAASRFYFSPLKVMEYMAAEVCPVVSAVGQINDLVEHGRTGLLTMPGDIRSLADELSRAANSPSLCRRLARSAREQILHNTWDSIAQRSADAAFEMNHSLPYSVAV